MARKYHIWPSSAFGPANAVTERIVYFESNFESGTIVPPWTTYSTDTQDWSMQVNGNQVHSGSKSLEIHYLLCPTLATQVAPTLSQVAGGSMGARTYFVKYTLHCPVRSGSGEYALSNESSLAVSANNLLKVTSPASGDGRYFWHVWVSTTTGNETRQEAESAPVAIGSDWTEPTSGLIAGAAYPGSPSNLGDDVNRFVVKTLTQLDHVFIRGYFYLKTPESGARQNIGRKLFYIFAPAVCSGSSCWQVIIANGGADQNKINVTIQRGGYSLPTLGPYYNNGPVLNFDQWYCLETEILANTPGIADGIIRCWEDGSLIYDSSVANPGTGLLFRNDSTGLTDFEIGDQAQYADGDLGDEYRYWDDLVVSSTYTGP